MIAKKLRKLPENEREHLMYEIDGMFIQRYYRFNNPLLFMQPTSFPGKFSTIINTKIDHHISLQIPNLIRRCLNHFQ